MAQRLIWPSLVLLFGATICGATLTAQRPKPATTDRTLVVMLGTGNPAIDPDRSGPATATGGVREVLREIPHNDHAVGRTGIEGEAKLLVLYHHSANTPEKLNAEMGAVYAGHFIVSRDLDVY
jgi:hypothetical protein